MTVSSDGLTEDLARQPTAEFFAAPGKYRARPLFDIWRFCQPVTASQSFSKAPPFGPFLAIQLREQRVFRAIVLSIVLSVVVGPSVSLLCRTWCHQETAAASGCHHENPSTTPSVAGDESCNNVVLGAAAVLREDVRRGVSSPEANQAIPVPRYQFAPSTIDACLGFGSGRDWPLKNRPLVTALRI